MNANLAALAIADHDDLRELKARVVDLEEAVRSLRVQINAVRDHADDIEESLLERRLRS